MAIAKWDDENEYFITFYKSYENSFWYRFKEAFKYVFLGKDIIGTELILEEKDFGRLRNFNND